MPASIFNGTAVKILKNILKYKDGTTLSSAQVTALLAGTTAPESIFYQTYAGYGSTNNKIPYFSNATIDTSSSLMTIANSSTNGLSIEADADILVNMTFFFDGTSGVSALGRIGISLNSTQLTTSIDSITVANRVAYNSNFTASNNNSAPSCSVSIILADGDILRPHTNGNAPNNSALAGLTLTAQAI